MHCMRKESAVHLYQHNVYAFCAFPWRFYALDVKKGFLLNCLHQYLEIADVTSCKKSTALLASMRLLAMPYNHCEQQKSQSFLLI